jgi:DNA-binding NarL/FixJ family response regulator
VTFPSLAVIIPVNPTYLPTFQPTIVVMAIRMIVAEDHEITRLAIMAHLASIPLEVIAQTSTGAETLEKVASLSPELLLLDIRFPDMDGFEILKQLHEADSSPRVAVVSTFENPTYVARSIVWGADDYLTKGLPTRDFKAAPERFGAGQSPYPDTIYSRIRELLSRRRDRGTLQGASLTYREYQLLRHVALGLSNHEITLSLQISIETVKEHVQNILRKTDASDRTQLAVWATREGIV